MAHDWGELAIVNISSTDVVVEVDTLGDNVSQKIERHVETIPWLKISKSFVDPLTVKRKVFVRDDDDGEEYAAFHVTFEGYLAYRAAIMVFDDPMTGTVTAAQLTLADMEERRAAYKTMIEDEATKHGFDTAPFVAELEEAD